MVPAQTFQPRPIRHALFKNLSQPDAVARLEGKGEDGAWLFRPHPRGVHLLHLTIRLAADCYLHMEIREGSKVIVPRRLKEMKRLERIVHRDRLYLSAGRRLSLKMRAIYVCSVCELTAVAVVAADGWDGRLDCLLAVVSGLNGRTAGAGGGSCARWTKLSAGTARAVSAGRVAGRDRCAVAAWSSCCVSCGTPRPGTVARSQAPPLEGTGVPHQIDRL